MKIFIMTDLEGPAGVNRWIQTREGETPEKHAAMRLLTAEVNAAIEGILQVAPEADVVVYDGHGTGGIVFEELSPAARVIMHGRGMRTPYSLHSSYDGLMFVGQHAMAGTPNAPLCHSYSSRRVEYFKLNGELIGEFGSLAAMAGAMGVPTIFLSGDDKACAEATSLHPRIVTAPTKEGLGIELALHLSAARSQQNIREGAARAIQELPRIGCVVIPPPYELEIRVQEGYDIESYLQAGMQRLDDRTAVRKGDSLSTVYS